MKYVDDQTIIDDYLPGEVSDISLETIGRMNESVSEMIDYYTGRVLPGGIVGYYLPTGDTATARTFRGDGSNCLQIPAHVRGSVSIDGIASNSIYENATNGWIYAGDSSDGYFGNDDDAEFENGFFTRGKRYVVRARWGFEATPAPICEAVKMIVARWFDIQHGVLGQITPGGFVIERDAPPAAILLLRPFIKREFEIS